MGRARKRHALSVWMNGVRVGRWCVSATGLHELHYDEAWLASSIGRPLSLSMPLRPANAPYKGELVANYFENLLPDNRAVRERLAQRFGTGAEPVELLSEIGRDCVGAIQLLPEDAAAPALGDVAVRPLTDDELCRHLADAVSADPFRANERDKFRISLAGAQEKTAFVWYRDQWCTPEGATPTTHIFKLPLGQVPGGLDLSTSVENEWLCGQLLTALGIPTSRSQMLSVDEQPVLVVERFDRKWASPTRLLRLPQEDFAQVYGMPPTRKYEEDGGPGISAILDTLRGSVSAQQDRADFFRTVVTFWMLAAIDGHAKNFSVFIGPRGQFRLAPRYDVLSAYPVMGHGAGLLAHQKATMAMAVWGRERHYRWSGVVRRHFEQTAKHCRIPEPAELIDELVARVPAAIDAVQGMLPRKFPESIANAIFEGLRAASGKLARAA